jgi:hypothetical protein
VFDFKLIFIFIIGSSVSIATCMTVGVYGNPQFSIWSWGLNYGFAYNLPTNSSDYLHPPDDVSVFPFIIPEEPTTTTTTEEPITDHHHYHHHHHHSSEGHHSEEHLSEEYLSSDPDIGSRRKFHVYRQPPKFETLPMIHRRYRRDMYRNIEAVIDK